MLTPKTYFEQVPLEIVSKILAAEIQPEEATKRAQQAKDERRKKNHPRARAASRERAR